MPGCTTNSNILLESILENCLDIITVKDLSGRYIACNKAFLSITGIDSEEKIIGRRIGEVLPFEGKKYVIENLEKVLQTGKPQSYTFHVCTDRTNKIINQYPRIILIIRWKTVSE